MLQFSTAPATTTLNTTVVGQAWFKEYQLGLGVDAVTGQMRASGVKAFRLKPSQPKTSEFFYSLVQSESDLQTLIAGSASGSYNLEGVTVSASTEFLNSIAVSELAVTLVAEVRVEDEEYSLAADYQLGVTPGSGFRDRYGDYFVAGYRAASSLYAIYQCRFSSAQQRTEFSAKMAAEAPQVMSAAGSAKFEQISKQCSASVSTRIVAQGTDQLPSPPPSGWTPETIVSVLIPWFNANMRPAPKQVYLEHYRLLDPSIPNVVAINPNVFAQLSFLYDRFWLARALYNACPDFGRRLVADRFPKLRSRVEAYQASLPDEPQMIEELTNETRSLLDTLREINHRQAFYTRAVAAAKTEPPARENHDADKGVVRWTYGFQSGDAPGVTVSSQTDTVARDWKIGWQEHVFHFGNSGRIIVGWNVTCNRSTLGGDWYKISDRIIGRSSGDVYVKSDYDRGFSWTITWYFVEAALYPAGPWTIDGVHAPEFVSAPGTCDGAEDVCAFWTPERMAGARPADRPFTEDAAAPEPGPEIPGMGGASAPSSAEADPMIGPDTSRVAHPDLFPHRTVGKLFFMMGGQAMVASGAVVHRTGIMTAAHCLLLGGQQASQLMFVPACHGGQEPFGRWAVSAFFWPTAWAASESPAWDLGFCHIAQGQGGGSIGDAVGWVGLAWGGAAGCWNTMGYPVQPIPGFPFDGAEPWQCLGSQMPSPAGSVITKHGNLSAGSSGGPWFVAGDPLTVNGVQSQVSASQSRSPEFAGWVGTFFHQIFP